MLVKRGKTEIILRSSVRLRLLQIALTRSVSFAEYSFKILRRFKETSNCSLTSSMVVTLSELVGDARYELVCEGSVYKLS
jgi:hypothetical protein